MVRARLAAVTVLGLLLAPATLPHVAASRAAAFGEPVVSQPPLPTEKRASGQDEPDAEPGTNQTHAIYFVPRDAVDNQLEDSIRGAIGTIRGWFRRETSKNGKPPIHPRFDKLQGGGWDVTFVAGDKDSAEYTGVRAISDELVAKGFNSANKRYLVWAETRGPESRCGESNYGLPALAAAPYAVVYLHAREGCGPRDLDGRAATTAAHEWLHVEGVVPAGARHYCASSLWHVCTGALWMVPSEQDQLISETLCGVDVWCEYPRLDPEATDIMYPLTWRALDGMELDRNNDDYLDVEVADSSVGVYNLRSSPWMETV